MRPNASVAVFFSLWLPLSSALEGFQRIDDTHGDTRTGFKPIYSPDSGVWRSSLCPTCTVQPDSGKAVAGTWTTGTASPGDPPMSIELRFKGNGIFVHFILARKFREGTPYITDCNFTLDGQHQNHFLYHDAAVGGLVQNEFVYNAPVFSVTGLEDAEHTLVISTHTAAHEVLLNFDYADYSVVTDISDSTLTSSPLSTPTKTSNPAASSSAAASGLSTASIVGISVAVIVVVSGIALAIILLIRRHRQLRQHLDLQGVEPYRSAAPPPLPTFGQTAASSYLPRTVSFGQALSPVTPGATSSTSLGYTATNSFASSRTRSTKRTRQLEEQMQNLIRSIHQLMGDSVSSNPQHSGRDGWEPDSDTTTQASSVEMRRLRAQVDQLRQQVVALRTETDAVVMHAPPPSYDRVARPEMETQGVRRKRRRLGSATVVSLPQ